MSGQEELNVTLPAIYGPDFVVHSPGAFSVKLNSDKGPLCSLVFRAWLTPNERVDIHAERPGQLEARLAAFIASRAREMRSSLGVDAPIVFDLVVAAQEWLANEANQETEEHTQETEVCTQITEDSETVAPVDKVRTRYFTSEVCSLNAFFHSGGKEMKEMTVQP